MPPASHEHLAPDHPKLEIEVIEADPEDTVPALLLGDLDLVFADDYQRRPVASPALDRQHLLDGGLNIVLPQGDSLAQASEVRLADPWASGQAGSAYAEAVERACRELGPSRCAGRSRERPRWQGWVAA